MKVAFIQRPYVLGDKKANINIMKDQMNGISADLFVFPEMFLTGYGIKQKHLTLAEKVDGPSVTAIRDFCKKMKKGVVFGMPRACDKVRGHVYNCCVMVLPNGEVYHYDKWFLAEFGPFEEYQYFQRGKKLTLVPTPWGKIGLEICFDLFLPELTKAYAVSGADMVINISASPSSTRPFFEKVLPARAIENTMFMLYSNIIGNDNNIVFWGGAQVYGPRGGLIDNVEPFKEENLKVDIDLDELAIARHARPTLRDTRPEIFELILKEYDSDYGL